MSHCAQRIFRFVLFSFVSSVENGVSRTLACDGISSVSGLGMAFLVSPASAWLVASRVPGAGTRQTSTQALTCHHRAPAALYPSCLLCKKPCLLSVCYLLLIRRGTFPSKAVSSLNDVGSATSEFQSFAYGLHIALPSVQLCIQGLSVNCPGPLY